MHYAPKPGDVVHVKSAEEPMTVEEVRSDGSVLCVWWDHSANDARRDNFRKDDLVLVR